MNIRVNIVKVKYKFDDNEIYGVELRFAPKVKKFLCMNKDTKDLLDLVGNGLGRWYSTAEFGDDLTLSVTLSDNPNEKIVAANQVVDPNLGSDNSIYSTTIQTNNKETSTSNFWD